MPAYKPSNLRIDKPKSGYKRKQANQTYYYIYPYLYKSAPGYRDDLPKSLLVGRLDNDDKLEPNSTYFSFFGKKETDCEAVSIIDNIKINKDIGPVCSVGFDYLIDETFKELELDEILIDTFGLKMANHIITLAKYFCLCNSTLYLLDDLLSKHKSWDIDSRNASILFADLESIDKNEFFKMWVDKVDKINKKSNLGEEINAYDVTSISRFGELDPRNEYGYNRDKEEIPQINLGMFTGIKSRLPLFYDTYCGSIVDQENIIVALNKAKKIGLNKINIVTDGMFFKEDKLKELNDMGIKFAIGMPKSRNESKEILDKYREKTKSIFNATIYNSTYALLVPYECFGIKGNVCVIYNMETANMENESCKEVLFRYDEELKEKKIKNYQTILKNNKYSKLYDIIPHKDDNGYDYMRSKEKIEEQIKNNGYALVFTNIEHTTSEDIVFFYREKDADEKIFYELKNPLNSNRYHTHGLKTTEGKTFVLFISTIINRYIRNKYRNYLIKKGLSLKELYKKLDLIESIKIKNDYVLASPLSKTQKEALNYLDFDINKLLKS